MSRLVPQRIRTLCARLAPRWDKKSTLSPSEAIECGCCFDHVRPDQIVQCDEGHVFCRTCLKSYVESRLGEHKTEFKCMDLSMCNSHFRDTQISRCIPKKTFLRLQTIRQHDDIRKAALPNFKSCPFCSYGVCLDLDMDVDVEGEDGVDDVQKLKEELKKGKGKSDERPKVFKCKAKGCGITSCMRCERKNHLPKTCEEVARAWEEKHEMEEAKSSALIRRCPGCDIAFVRNEGCAMMSCNCQHLSCYVCRRTVQPFALPEEHAHCQKLVNKIERRNIREAERRVRNKRRVEKSTSSTTPKSTLSPSTANTARVTIFPPPPVSAYPFLPANAVMTYGQPANTSTDTNTSASATTTGATSNARANANDDDRNSIMSISSASTVSSLSGAEEVGDAETSTLGRARSPSSIVDRPPTPFARRRGEEASDVDDDADVSHGTAAPASPSTSYTATITAATTPDSRPPTAMSTATATSISSRRSSRHASPFLSNWAAPVVVVPASSPLSLAQSPAPASPSGSSRLRSSMTPPTTTPITPPQSFSFGRASFRNIITSSSSTGGSGSSTSPTNRHSYSFTPRASETSTPTSPWFPTSTSSNTPSSPSSASSSSPSWPPTPYTYPAAPSQIGASASGSPVIIVPNTLLSGGETRHMRSGSESRSGLGLALGQQHQIVELQDIEPGVRDKSSRRAKRASAPPAPLTVSGTSMIMATTTGMGLA